MPRKLLGEILRRQGKITPEQLEKALSHQRESREILGRILYHLGAVDERDLQEAWGVQLGMEFIDLPQTLLSAELIKRLTGEMARRYWAIPVREEEGMVVVAMANPLDVRALGEIAKQIGSPVRSAIASANELEEAIEKYYS